jgi:hypothetical protein
MLRRTRVDFVQKRADARRLLLEAHKNVALSLQARVVHRLDDYIDSKLVAVAQMSESVRFQ